MRRATILAAAAIVLIPLGLRAQDEGFYPYSYARLSYVNGSVYVQRAADLGYEKGEVNLALVQGDKLGTEDGQAEVHFGRRNYLRIDSGTKVDLVQLPAEGEELIRLHLLEGSAYLRVSRLVLEKGVEVHTPDASFYVLDEGLYRFDVNAGRETTARVQEGSLEAAAEDGSVLVRYGESVTASDGRIVSGPGYYSSRRDRFDDWNSSRDEALEARSARSYLPSAIEEYEQELAAGGDWIYERPYGYVWVPRVVYAGWSPYLYGRWVWYPVIGWTWVSSEPWGWAVYHYGRWHWRFGLGWYWIPHVHWGPAWVHWWWDADYVGWCPLSWYNRPVVIVNNYFYDRFDGREIPVHNRALTVVRRHELQSPALDRHRLQAGELGRIRSVSLRAEQPAIRPRVDNLKPQAIEARRVLAARPGSRAEIKAVPPSSGLSSGRASRAPVSASVRVREPAPAAQERDISRSEARNSSLSGRAIRSFPSRRSDEASVPRAVVSPRSGSSPSLRSETEAARPARQLEGSQGPVRRETGTQRELSPSKGQDASPRAYPSRTPAPAKPAEPQNKGRGTVGSSEPVRRLSSSFETPRPSYQAPSYRTRSSGPAPSSGSDGLSSSRSFRPSAPSSSGRSAISSGASPRLRSPSSSRSSRGLSLSSSRPSSVGPSSRSYSAPRSGGGSAVRASAAPSRSASSSSRSGSSSSKGSVSRRKG